MIARVQDTTQGFVIVIPPEYVKAWGLRQDFPLEVHRVGSNHEKDEPAFLEAQREAILGSFAKTLLEHDQVFRELAKGPEGLGPHEPAPFDLKKW